MVRIQVWYITISAVSSFALCSGLVSYFPACVILCITSSLILFSRFGIRTFRMAFFLFLLSYVFCCIYSTTFSTFKSFSFNSLSLIFLWVIDVINFDIRNSVLKSGKFLSTFSSINFSQRFSGVSVFVCFAQRILLVSCFCFLPTNIICFIV